MSFYMKTSEKNNCRNLTIGLIFFFGIIFMIYGCIHISECNQTGSYNYPCTTYVAENKTVTSHLIVNKTCNYCYNSSQLCHQECTRIGIHNTCHQKCDFDCRDWREYNCYDSYVYFGNNTCKMLVDANMDNYTEIGMLLNQKMPINISEIIYTNTKTMECFDYDKTKQTKTVALPLIIIGIIIIVCVPLIEKHSECKKSTKLPQIKSKKTSRRLSIDTSSNELTFNNTIV